MQAANSMTGINHISTTLTTPRKYFHYAPNRADLRKRSSMSLINQKWRSSSYLTLIKLSDTRWLAHKWCKKAVKASYTALVATLDCNYKNIHAPEALGLYNALSKFTTIAAIYLQDYTLPLVAKLSKSHIKKQL